MNYKLIVLVLMVLVIGGADAARADHAWGSYHWARSANPFSLALGDNLTAVWDGHLAQASQDWSLSLVLDTHIVAGGTNLSKGKYTPKNCVPTQGRAEICNAKYGSTGWLGIASIWASGAHISAGTVKMNDTYFNTPSYNTAAWKNLVMCQEVGHLFGLGHQDETFTNANLDTCMDYTNSPSSNQHPNAHDYAMLEEIYAHLDAGAATAEAPAALAADSNDPRSWGAEAHRSQDGRASIFVQDLGEGNRIIRHVFWVEPRGAHRD